MQHAECINIFLLNANKAPFDISVREKNLYAHTVVSNNFFVRTYHRCWRGYDHVRLMRFAFVSVHALLFSIHIFFLSFLKLYLLEERATTIDMTLRCEFGVSFPYLIWLQGCKGCLSYWDISLNALRQKMHWAKGKTWISIQKPLATNK